MANLKEIIANIVNLKASGVPSDDKDISDSQWVFIINYYRAKLIRQDFERGRTLNESVVQDLGKIQVKEEESSVSCRIYTTPDLPVPLEVYKQNLITYVGPYKLNEPYQKTTRNKIEWEFYGKYTGNLTKWYQKENKIYVLNKNRLNVINVQGVFEDPVAVRKFLNKLDPFDPYNFEYPVSITMLDTIYKLILDSEVRTLLTIPEDTTNDGQS